VAVNAMDMLWAIYVFLSHRQIMKIQMIKMDEEEIEEELARLNRKAKKNSKQFWEAARKIEMCGR